MQMIKLECPGCENEIAIKVEAEVEKKTSYITTNKISDDAFSLEECPKCEKVLKPLSDKPIHTRVKGWTAIKGGRVMTNEWIMQQTKIFYCEKCGYASINYDNS